LSVADHYLDSVNRAISGFSGVQFEKIDTEIGRCYIQSSIEIFTFLSR